MLALVVVFLFPSTPNASATDMNYSVVVFGGVMFLSVVWYYFPKYGGVHWFTGPVATISMEAPELLGGVETPSPRRSKSDPL